MDLRKVNGVCVWQQPTDRFTRNIISVSFITPIDRNTAMTALLPGVLRCGCQRLPSLEQLNLFLEEHYGATFSAVSLKKGECQVVRFSVSFLDDQLALDGDRVCADMTAFLQDMITAPRTVDGVLDPALVATEKQNLKDKIAARRNEKLGYAMHRCVSLMCDGERFGLDEFGTPEEIDAVTAESLTAWYRQWFAEAVPFVYSCGRVPTETVESFVKALFPAVRNAVLPKTLFVPKAESVRSHREQMPVSQSQLVMGFRTGTQSYADELYSLLLFQTVYGSGTMSRLFVNVREKLSLCYYCSTRMDGHKGILLAFAGVRRENTEKARDEILAQLADLAAGNVSETELEDALREVRNLYTGILDDPGQMESFCLNAYLGQGEPDVEKRIAMLDTVTAADIVRVAGKISLDTVYVLEGTGEGSGEDEI